MSGLAMEHMEYLIERLGRERNRWRVRALELEQGVTTLHKDLIKAIERGKPCEHATLGTPYLPCPHPECYSGRDPYLAVAMQPDPSYSWARPEDPIKPLRTEYWTRQKALLDDEEVWAWRRA